MLTRIIDWLDASPTRWHMVNIAQWTAIMSLSGAARGALGAVLLLALAIWAIRTAVGAGFGKGQLHPFTLLLSLWPQVFGLMIAALALHFSEGSGWADLWLVLFGLQTAAVVMWTTQITQGKSQTCQVPRWTEAG